MKEPSEEVKEVERRYEKALDDMEKHYKDVLDKIRAEIYEHFMTIDGGVHDKSAIKCMELIDKYR